MSLLFAELRKVWGHRVFPLLLAVLAAANLLLLWMGTRPTANQPVAAAYKAVGSDLAGMTMEEKGTFLHGKLTEYESLLRIDNYYRQLAYGGNVTLQSYREGNAPLFEEYEPEYQDKSYDLYTDSLTLEYRLFYQLCGEYDTVAGYGDFLDSVQTKATQLAGISIFQKDSTGYDLKNIEVTARVYAGLKDIVIDYYPQKGLYTALSYAFTDLILLAAMLLLALLLVRQERDSGLLTLVRSLPGGRLQTALAKLGAFALSLLAVLLLLYGVNLAYCKASFGLGPLSRTIQSVPALMRCTMQITVGRYLFRFLLAKWAGAFVMGLWVMLAALLARRAAAGWVGALVLPGAMYAVRAAIPATSRLNVVKYANLASLMQTNELLGNYRNLYWFGSPVGLPLVEWAAAVLFGSGFAAAFCAVFARAQLLPAPKRSILPVILHKTRPTTVLREETRKLLVMNGAAVFLAVFIGFGIWQGVTAESYLSAEEIYYAGYMKEISGPYTQQTRTWLEQQGEEFAPLLAAQQKVAAGELSPDALLAYSALQQKYGVYQRIITQNINGYLGQHPRAWLVYESGYQELFGFSGTADIQDTLYAGLLCALCFSGLFAMERKGGMEEILCTTPLGRRRTVRAKLAAASVAAVLIAAGTCLPHLIQVLRDYGLPALFAPAMSVSELQSLPAVFTLSDLLLFWVVCRVAACVCMGAITLTLGRAFGNALPALFLSAVAYCLPPLLDLSGMEGGIRWLGFWPLFHAAALPAEGAGVVAPVLLGAAVVLSWGLGTRLCDQYEWKGILPED